MDVARRVARTCRRDGCDAPPRSHGAKHCQVHAYEDMRQRAAEVAQRRRKAWLPQPKAPTETQVSCYLRNRDRDPHDLIERERAVAELTELERGRILHLGSMPKRAAPAVS